MPRTAPLALMVLVAAAGCGSAPAPAPDDEGATDDALGGVTVHLVEHHMRSTTTNWARGQQVQDSNGTQMVWLSTEKLPTDGWDVGIVKAEVGADHVLVLTAAPLAPPAGCATHAYPTTVNAWYSVSRAPGAWSTRVEWAASPHTRPSGSPCDPFAGAGRVAWATPLQRTTMSNLIGVRAADDDGTAYVDGPYDLWAVAPDGHVAWHATKTTNGVKDYDVLVDAHDVYASCDGLCAYSRTDGSLVWHVAGTDPWVTAPARAADGTMYVGSGDVIAVTPAGATAWTHHVAGFRFARPRVRPDGTIYVVATPTDESGTEQRLYALHPDGTEAWSLAFTRAGGGTPVTLLDAGGDGNAYLSRDKGVGGPELVVVSPTGTIARTGGFANWYGVSTPDGGFVTAGWNGAGKIDATGKTVWSYDAIPPKAVGSTRRWEPTFGAPVVEANGHVLLVAQSGPMSYWGYTGPVAELDAAGQEVMRVDLDDWAYAVAAGPSGLVYAVGDGGLYAVATRTP